MSNLTVDERAIGASIEAGAATLEKLLEDTGLSTRSDIAHALLGWWLKAGSIERGNMRQAIVRLLMHDEHAATAAEEQDRAFARRVIKAAP